MANLKSMIELQGYGTAEGVQKEWDTRGRGRNVVSTCVGDNCAEKEEMLDQHDPKGMPHIDDLHLEMSSDGNRNIFWGKEEMKMALRHALQQLEEEDTKITYLNTPLAEATDHQATIHFREKNALLAEEEN